ncbi:matrixin family metalloprotease [Aeoliella mucimassa]|uniref:matrixin family metalloprotease n=1 Tax=Aeoliella mucimassa TaxID=2527972 RepID=UPI0018D4C987|nr:matrixin family metalloprotease [Aeoliella mucimassa]
MATKLQFTFFLGSITFASFAFGYVPDERWSTTSYGSAGESGTPATLSWSIVPDGTSIPGEGDSDLIEYMDDIFGVTSSSTDLTERPWFELFESIVGRWGEVSGLTFEYEANDTGSEVYYNDGVLGTRGDIRFSGSYIDGSNNTLAYAWLPEVGDVVIDTGEASFFADSSDNYLAFRNTVMHEVGHALGLLHVESSSEVLLMEPVIDLSIDGPQLDDIRGMQGLYGDYYEKSNNGQGNGTYSLATSLGSLIDGGELSIGSDATGGQEVDPTETDFVSISNATDVDVYSFTIDQPMTLEALLTPLGGEFRQGVEGGQQSTFDANSRNDLLLTIFDSNGTTVMELANDTAAGSTEEIIGLDLTTAGTYYAEISGSSSSVQLYELVLSGLALFIESGDFNGDGIVDLADYTLWRDSFGATGTTLAADGNGDHVVDALDYSIWKSQFGTSTGLGGMTDTTVVPEPAGGMLLLCFAAASLAMIKSATF